MIKLTTIKTALIASAKEGLIGVAGAVLLILASLLVLGPFLGIAWLVDYMHNDWMLLLYIPYFLLFPILAKPLSKFYEN